MKARGPKCLACGEMLLRGDGERNCANPRCERHLKPVVGEAIEVPDLSGWRPHRPAERPEPKTGWWR